MCGHAAPTQPLACGPSSGLSEDLELEVKDRSPERRYAEPNFELPNRKPDPRLLENRSLATDAETLNESRIPLWTAIFQIIKQFPPTRNQAQQTTFGVMIFLMRLEMLSQLRNTLTQEGNLYLWGARIRLVNPVLGDYLRFLFRRQGHAKKRYSSSLP
jgi:hypothetical protein